MAEEITKATGAKRSPRRGKGETALDRVYGKLMGPNATVTILKGDERLFAHIGKILNRKD